MNFVRSVPGWNPTASNFLKIEITLTFNRKGWDGGAKGFKEYPDNHTGSLFCNCNDSFYSDIVKRASTN